MSHSGFCPPESRDGATLMWQIAQLCVAGGAWISYSGRPGPECDIVKLLTYP